MNVIVGHGKTTSVLLALAVASTACIVPEMTVQPRDIEPVEYFDFQSKPRRFQPQRGAPKGYQKNKRRGK